MIELAPISQALITKIIFDVTNIDHEPSVAVRVIFEELYPRRIPFSFRTAPHDPTSNGLGIVQQGELDHTGLTGLNRFRYGQTQTALTDISKTRLN
jgi:hypothetical protein